MVNRSVDECMLIARQNSKRKCQISFGSSLMFSLIYDFVELKHSSSVLGHYWVLKIKQLLGEWFIFIIWNHFVTIVILKTNRQIEKTPATVLRDLDRPMDDNNNNKKNNTDGVALKKKPTKTRNMTRKETIAYLKGIITRFPKFIPPPPKPFIPPNLTLHDQIDFYNALTASRPGFSIFPGTYSPATAPGQLSLPELDVAARVAPFSIEIFKRKNLYLSGNRKRSCQLFKETNDQCLAKVCTIVYQLGKLEESDEMQIWW